MKIKLRISALLISVLLIFNISVFPSLANTLPDETEFSRYKLMCDLGLLSDELAEDTDLSKELTRAEFASIISRLMNFKGNGFSYGKAADFSDIKEDNIYYKDIGYAVDAGIVTGAGDGLFQPTRKITYAQAVKMLVVCLGYDELAQNKGGFPTGYLSVAASIGMDKGLNLSGEAKLTKADCYLLVNNAMDTPVLEASSITGGNTAYTDGKGNTLLSLYHKIYKYQGTIKADNEVSLVNIDPLSKEEILIDKNIYKTRVQAPEYIGRLVYYYYSSDDKEIVAITPVAGTGETIVVEAKNIVSYNSNLLRYEVNGRVKEAHISRSASIAYNGRPALGLRESDYEIDEGEIYLVKEANTSDYSSVIISSADSFCIKKSDSYNEMFYDLYDGDKFFSAEDTEIISFVNKFGEEMSLTELSKYDVISVFKSYDGKYARLVYSNTETEGRVEEISSDDDNVILTIGGQSYMAAANFKTEASNIKIGDDGIFVMNVYGNIAGMKPYGSSISWGYLIAVDEASSMGGSYRAKLLDSNGAVNIVKFAEHIELDGVRTKAKDVFTSLRGYTGGTPIRYYLQNNELKFIDTIAVLAGGTNDSTKQMYTGYDSGTKLAIDASKLMFNRYQQTFGLKVLINSKTKIFSIPNETTTNDEEYKLLGSSYFEHDKNYNVDAYSIGTGHAAEAIYVYNAIGAADEPDTTVEVGLVDRVTRVVDEEGISKYKVYYLQAGAMKESFVSSDGVIDNLTFTKVDTTTPVPHDLACGDLVRFGVNSVTGEITRIDVYYDAVNGLPRKNVKVGTNISDSNRIVVANVYSEDNGNLLVTQHPLDTAGIELGLEQLTGADEIKNVESIQASLYKIYLYTKDRYGKPEVKVADISYISDYKTNPDKFSKIVISSRYVNPGVIVIYE